MRNRLAAAVEYPQVSEVGVPRAAVNLFAEGEAIHRGAGGCIDRKPVGKLSRGELGGAHGVGEQQGSG
mgnify:CR=1 FL=1